MELTRAAVTRLNDDAFEAIPLVVQILNIKAISQAGTAVER